MTDQNVKYCWTNAGHQLADGFTKLSSAGARTDLLVSSIEQGLIQIIYSTQSGRKESQQQYSREQPTMFSLDDDLCDQEAEAQSHFEVDDLRERYYELV